MTHPFYSLLIAVYKRADYLALILEALTRQTFTNFEVVVCEDDEDASIRDCIEHWRTHSQLDIRHVHQPDIGFRKTGILNRGLDVAKGEYVLFIDGDCIPHHEFVHSYHAVARKGVAMHGRRVMLSDSLSNQLLSGEKKFPVSVWTLIRSGSEKIENSIRIPWLKRRSRQSAIWGCNWGIAREHLIEVNGFDEDYVKAGVGEDVDIEWRLQRNGIKLLNVKHQAIIYHMYHRQGYSDSDVALNFALMAQKQKDGFAACKNGLVKKQST